MRYLILLSSIVCGLFLTNCSSLSSQSDIEGAPATIRTSTTNFDYLVIQSINGDSVTSQNLHKVTPGNKKIKITGVFQGNALNSMNINTFLAPGKAYVLRPSAGEIREVETRRGIELLSSGFTPVITEEFSGIQVYPAVPGQEVEKIGNDGLLVDDQAPVYTAEETSPEVVTTVKETPTETVPEVVTTVKETPAETVPEVVTKEKVTKVTSPEPVAPEPAPRKKYNFEINPEAPVQKSDIYPRPPGSSSTPTGTEDKPARKRLTWY